MMTALSGTRSDRNTSMSSTKDSKRTTAMKAGSLAVRYSEKSTAAATLPETATSSPATRHPYPASRRAAAMPLRAMPSTRARRPANHGVAARTAAVTSTSLTGV